MQRRSGGVVGRLPVARMLPAAASPLRGALYHGGKRRMKRRALSHLQADTPVASIKSSKK